MTLHPILALNQVIDKYGDYLRTEFRAKDPALREALERELDRPLFLAQEPFFRAHRPFRSGRRWRDLPIDPRLARVMEDRARAHGSATPEYTFTHQSAAIVADSYGLGRDQYKHVPSTFTDVSYPRAPELRLARFDELMKTGLDAYTKRHDPYWDTPLNESLPEPVIELPIPGEGEGEGPRDLFGNPLQANLFGEVEMPKSRRSKP